MISRKSFQQFKEFRLHKKYILGLSLLGVIALVFLSGKALLGYNKVVNNVNLHSGIVFIESENAVGSATLYYQGMAIQEISRRTVFDKLNNKNVTGYDIPGIWYGKYELRWLERDGLAKILGLGGVTKVEKIEIGDGLDDFSIESCVKKGPGSIGNTCLVEAIAKEVERVGGSAARDEVLKYYDSQLVSYCAEWLGGYAAILREKHGLLGAYSDKYLICKYTYLHMLVANEVLYGTSLDKMAEFCATTEFTGMDKGEATNQCSHGVGFASVIELNMTLENALKSCFKLSGILKFYVSNCYEGVYRGLELKSSLSPEILPKHYLAPWEVNTLPKPESCLELQDDFKPACYRFTMRSSITEEMYKKSDKEKEIFMLNWRDKLCRIDTHYGCWYGIADSSFLLFGTPPFRSAFKVEKELWPVILNLCLENSSKTNPVCSERLTHMNMNKLLDKKELEPWCIFLNENSDQYCTDESINGYIARFESGKRFDPWAIKAEEDRVNE